MFRVLPPFGADQRNVAEVVNGIMNGKTNNTGTVTLNTGGAINTTITDARIGIDSVILLAPKSSAANTNTSPYGAFSDFTDQTITANTATVMTLNTTDYSNGVSVVTSGGKASRITVANAGIYNFQWSGQFENTDNSSHDLSIWIRKNGTDIAGSAGLIHMLSRKSASEYYHLIVGWNYFIELAANDYIELWWSAQNASISLQHYAAGTSPTRPSTASLVATMQLVNNNAATDIYVSSQTNGSAVLTHFANSTANKTYKYIIVG